MGNRQLQPGEIQTLETETGLPKAKIVKAFDKFKKLAGKKSFVAISDLKAIIGDIPIYEEVAQAFSNNGEVDFRTMLDMIVTMSEENRGSIMQRKLLYRLYDQDGDGVISREEMSDLLFKITSQNLPAMTRD